jgi:hypothetical protein
VRSYDILLHSNIHVVNEVLFVDKNLQTVIYACNAYQICVNDMYIYIYIYIYS